MIRVLQVVSGLNYGGVAATIMNYYRNIDRSKIQFDFTTTASGGRLESEVRQLGGRIFELPSKSRHPFKYMKALKRIIKENKYDIVHSNTNSASAFLDLYPAKKAGCKIRIAHSHNTNCKIKWQHKIFKPLLPFVVTNRFACSKLAGEWLFGKNKNCRIINNGIDFDFYGFDNDVRESVRDKMEWAGNFVIGNVASFQERKNQRFLIELMPILLKLIPNVKLVLVGDGETRATLAEECDKLQITDHVQFTGNRNDVRDLLQGFDMFCFPSKFEGVSVAYMEAVASGLPVLISDNVPYIPIGNQIWSLPLVDEYWIDKIVNVYQLGSHRESFTLKQRADSNYDIKELSRELEKIYEELVLNCEDKANG